jgi:hypothetical protein
MACIARGQWTSISGPVPGEMGPPMGHFLGRLTVERFEPPAAYRHTYIG